jgi:hypothetical protein
LGEIEEYGVPEYGGKNLMGQIARDYLYKSKGSGKGVRGRGDYDSLEKVDYGELRGTREGSRQRNSQYGSDRDD